MKCTGCGKEFEGEFCPNCGKPAEDKPVVNDVNNTPVTNTPPTQSSPVAQNVPDFQMNLPKKDTPLYKKWWFWLIISVTIILVVTIIAVVCLTISKKSTAPVTNTTKVTQEEKDSKNDSKKDDTKEETKVEKTTKKEENETSSGNKEYDNALKLAKTYATDLHLSKKGVYDQLISEYGENLSEDAAQYAIDHLTDINWKENALVTAKSYASDSHLSKKSVHDQLVSEYGEEFTEEEAQYAMDNLTGVDWKENALITAKSYATNSHMSKKSVHDQLVSEYGEEFTEEEAQYAMDNLTGIDWNENALITAKSYYEDMNMPESEIYNQLVSEYGEEFTPSEAQYAVDHLLD